MPALRAVAAVLVALLVVVVPTAAGPAEPAAANPATTPTMLTLSDGRTSGFVSPSIDVSATLAIDHRTAAARVDRRALTTRLERVSDAETKQRILFLAATETKRAAVEIRADEAAARHAYLNGSISAEAYARTAGIHSAGAAQLRRTMTHIGRLADRVPGITVRQRILETRLIGFGGPVRTHLLAALYGSTAGNRVHVIATRNGTVLSTFAADGTYLREAYRSDRWTRNEVGDASLPDIVDTVRSRYPTAYNRSTSTSFTGGLGRGIYETTLRLPDGRLEAHIDADTGDVFYEVLRGDPAEITSNAAVTEETTSLRIVVNRTVPGGPLRIATVNAWDGTPVNRPVVVDGKAYQTGEDGVLWTLTPNKPRIPVRVATDDGPLTITVRPVLPGSEDTGADAGPQPT